MRHPPRWGHVVGFDDAPFSPDHRGDVLVVGAVYAGERLDGILSCRVRRDGANATDRLAACVAQSRFYPQLHAVLLQGISFGGFNVVDIEALSTALARPVLVVCRRRPDRALIRTTLLTHIRGGERKWRSIDRAGEPNELVGLYVQCAGIRTEDSIALLRRHSRHGKLPEPLRTAHLIAGGIARGESCGRA
jgi:endonuclease V-like protein UPF0215 family